MRDVTVDTCVLRAAGETSDEQSIEARSALDAIARSGAAVLADRDLSLEWTKHASAYALKWWASLETQARFYEVSVGAHCRAAFHEGIKDLDASNLACARKDMHLILVAIHFFALLVSSETRSRNVFARLIGRFDALANVHWVSPREYVRLEQVCSGTIDVPLEWSLTHASAG